MVTKPTIWPNGRFGVPQITPYTYRDGQTLLELITALRDHVVDQLHPNLQKTIDQLVADVETEYEKSHDRYVAGVQEFQRIHDAFMADVNAKLMALNDDAVTSLVDDATSLLGRVLREIFSVKGEVKPQYIHADSKQAKDYGVELVADGELVNGQVRGVDNTYALNRLFELSRETGQGVYLPAGVYRVDGELDISGITLVGDYHGYYNTHGTRILANQTGITFNQRSTKLSLMRMHLENIRIDNARIGIRTSYTVYSQFSRVYVVDAQHTGFILGDEHHAAAGPIWNTFDACRFSSVDGAALYFGGADWNNANVFNTCDFRTHNPKAAAVHMDTKLGYGALNNTFHNTEIRGAGAGIRITGQNRSTQLNGCYMESSGPGVIIQSATQDFQVNGGVWGTLRNDNDWKMPAFIYHQSSQFHVNVNGGWVTLGPGDHKNDLAFIHSDTGTAILTTIARPHTLIQSKGYTYKTGTFVENTTLEGDVTIRDRFRPGLRAAFDDGTMPFVLERNGVQGGNDEGVVFTNNGQRVFTAKNNGRLHLARSPQLDGEAFQAGTPGYNSEGDYLVVYTESGSPRYIPTYRWLQ